ncbi:hypothetical protein F4779DRAFT_634135 [Xylariaceae sp. FL0662B]|nr:hypothetical protein F4779DRAFT_634135 [Xylariaceae sp. FL0662B]
MSRFKPYGGKYPDWRRNEAFGGRPFLKLQWEPLVTCYSTSFVAGSGVQAAKASTLSSDRKDRKGYLEAGGPGVANIDHFTHPTEYACSIDICTWFTSKANTDGWPKIDAARVQTATTDAFRAGLRNNDRPVDGLKTFGSTMLHELTHTNHGGKLVDVSDRPEGVESCYGWKCIGQLHSAKNADSVAMLAIALKVWSLRHYVDDDGNIHPLP